MVNSYGSKRIKLSIAVIVSLVLSAMIITAAPSFAASGPTASGMVDSAEGAFLRSSSTVNSNKLAVLQDNTKLKIYKELFKSKTSTSSTSRWYYVKANGIKGYIRADLVDNIKYKSIKGTASKCVKYRKGAGTGMKKAGKIKKGETVTLCLKAMPAKSGSGSIKTWYKIKIGSKHYYVSSKWINAESTSDDKDAGDNKSNSYISAPVTNVTDSQFNAYLKSQGFPKSYRKKLKALHKAHPNWGFVAYKTGIKWSDAMKAESKKGRSLISEFYPKSYRKGSSQPERGWYNASDKVIAFYMDPRNFITEDSIYMFEDLSYKPSYQKKSVVNKILTGTKLPKCGFKASMFVKAGAKNNVSPVFLAARARQENGGGGKAVNGKSALGKVYNPFNIGAYGGKDPLYNGLVYAKAAGWNTPQKALNGGSALLAKYYINKGQHTIYYQRFNARNGKKAIGTHQYMTNIVAPYTEALSAKKSYSSYGITEHSLVFEIPIYSSMPSKTKLP